MNDILHKVWKQCGAAVIRRLQREEVKTAENSFQRFVTNAESGEDAR